HADAGQHEVATDALARRELDLFDATGAAERADHGPAAQVDPSRAVLLRVEATDLGAERAHERRVLGLEHHDLEALFAAGGGDLGADDAGADDHDALARSEPRAEVL